MSNVRLLRSGRFVVPARRVCSAPCRFGSSGGPSPGAASAASRSAPEGLRSVTTRPGGRAGFGATYARVRLAAAAGRRGAGQPRPRRRRRAGRTVPSRRSSAGTSGGTVCPQNAVRGEHIRSTILLASRQFPRERRLYQLERGPDLQEHGVRTSLRSATSCATIIVEAPHGASRSHQRKKALTMPERQSGFSPDNVMGEWRHWARLYAHTLNIAQWLNDGLITKLEFASLIEQEEQSLCQEVEISQETLTLILRALGRDTRPGEGARGGQPAQT